MTSTSRTKLNDSDEAPIFVEPIPADVPRRQFDRKLLEAYDADHERIRAMSSRLTRIEVAFENFTKDIGKLDQKQADILAGTEKAADAISLIANKLAIHTEMEEYQWTVVNQANKTLTDVGSALSQHLQESGALNTRISWVEKLLWALWGVVGAAGAMLIPYALKGMGIE